MNTFKEAVGYLEAAVRAGDWCPSQFQRALALIKEREDLAEVANERLKTLEWHRQQHMDAQERLRIADALAEAVGQKKCYEVGANVAYAYHAYTRARSTDEYYIRSHPKTYYRTAKTWHLALSDFDPQELGAKCGVHLDNGTYSKTTNPDPADICRRCEPEPKQP